MNLFTCLRLHWKLTYSNFIPTGGQQCLQCHKILGFHTEMVPRNCSICTYCHLLNDVTAGCIKHGIISLPIWSARKPRNETAVVRITLDRTNPLTHITSFIRIWNSSIGDSSSLPVRSFGAGLEKHVFCLLTKCFTWFVLPIPVDWLTEKLRKLGTLLRQPRWLNG